MSDESMTDLQKVYDEILGPGEEIKDDQQTVVGDEAYTEEDYTSESLEEGVDDKDPREVDNDDTEEVDNELTESEYDDEYEEYDGDDDETDEDFIPDHLVEVGRQAGLSDEEIIRLDAENPTFLESLADSKRSKEQEIVAPDTGDATEDEKKREVLSKLNIDATALELDENTAQAVTPIQEVVNKMVDRITELEEQLGHTSNGVDELSKSREAEFSNQIDGYFDSKVKDVPAFGLVKSMTQQQAKARTEAWEVARAIHNGSGGKIGLDEALETSVNALKGKVGEKQVKENLVNGLRNQKKRFTSRPRGGRRKKEPRLTEKQRALKAIDGILDGTE